MSITYKDKEIVISESKGKIANNVIYARPDDTIKLDFSISDVKVTFVNGDVDFIFKNGSIVSLASYSTLAFSNNAPEIYDNSGKIISLSDLLQKVSVSSPEEAVLILADRDQSKLVKQDKQVDKVIMASTQKGALEGGNPIAGPGDLAVETQGLPSNFIDKTGIIASANIKDGLGEYLYTTHTTNIFGKTNNDKQYSGNIVKVEQPTVSFKFLFGDSIRLSGTTDILDGGNKVTADYYSVDFSSSGSSGTSDKTAQLDQINVDLTNGSNSAKFVDINSADGKVDRILQIAYKGGVFPQGISIKGIPDGISLSLASSGQTTQLIPPSSAGGEYKLSKLDPSGYVYLNFTFDPNDTSYVGHSLSVTYTILYFDPLTSLLESIQTIQDIKITEVSKDTDLSSSSIILSTTIGGINVNKGSGDGVIVGGGYSNVIVSSGGNNLIFTGGGSDDVTLNGSGINVIYGSTGFDNIKASALSDNTVVFNNNKIYANLNNYDEASGKIKDNYFNTMNNTGSSSFYLGVLDPTSIWDSLGISGYSNTFRALATPNFVTSFNSITNLDEVQHIIGTNNMDTFYLHFEALNYQISIDGGSNNNKINLVGLAGDTITLNTKTQKISSSASANYYTYNGSTFTSISGGDEVDIFQIDFSGNSYNKNSVTYNGGPDSSRLDQYGRTIVWDTADFSVLSSFITFTASTGQASYSSPVNKAPDYFINVGKIVGTSYNDTFLGSSASKGYWFDGGNGGNNTLTYSSSIGGVTYDATNSRIYKTNNVSVYANLELNHIVYDKFDNIQNVILSNSNDVIFAGSASLSVDGGGGVNLIDYGSSTASSISLDVSQNSSSVTVTKIINGSPVSDILQNVQSFVGTNGNDTFIAGNTEFNNSFDGVGGTGDLLSYAGFQNTLSFMLKSGIVYKSNGYQDTFKNINQIKGGQLNSSVNIFQIAAPNNKFDPTNQNDVNQINGLSITGNGGNSSFSFTNTTIYTIDSSSFFLTYDFTSAVFAGKNGGSPITLSLQLTNVLKFVGTSALDLFIPNVNFSYIFDGGGSDLGNINSSVLIFGDTLSYANMLTSVTIDAFNGIVKKGSNQSLTDKFSNINALIGGQADDTIYAASSRGFYYNGYYSSDAPTFSSHSSITGNILSYEKITKSVIMSFDFQNHKVFEQAKPSVTDIFDEVSVIKGSSSSLGNIYTLSFSPISWSNPSGANSKVWYSSAPNSSSYIKIDPRGGANIIDFSNTGSNTGITTGIYFDTSSTNSDGVKINDTLHNANVFTSIYYDWSKDTDPSATSVSGYIGTKYSDYFIDSSGVSSLSIDGGGRSTGGDGDVVDFSGITNPSLGKYSINLDISTGQANKILTTSSAVTTSGIDVLTNINKIILTSGDDTVTYPSSNSASGLLTTLKVIDGGGGNNTIDFNAYTGDLNEVDITYNSSTSKSGFNLSNATGLSLTLNSFSIMIASQGITTFTVTANSANANVNLIGNNIDNSKSTLDLTNISGFVFYNLDAVNDTPKGSGISAGLLTWGSNTANIISSNISHVKIGSDGNTVYGSRNNNTSYDSSGTNNTLSYNWNGFLGSINVDLNKSQVSFGSKYDSYSGFSTIQGSYAGSDNFFITSLADLGSTIPSLNGGTGTNNALSFASDTIDQIKVNISSTLIIKYGDAFANSVTLNLTKISNLQLGSKESTVNITTDDATQWKFTNLIGYKTDPSLDTLYIDNTMTAVFNDQGLGQLKLTKGSTTSIITLSNFGNITTTTTSGNTFYGALQKNITYTVNNSTNTDSNTLSYVNSNSVVFVDFSSGIVYKGNDASQTSLDHFSGINTIYGSKQSDVFYLYYKQTTTNIFSTMKIYSGGGTGNDIISLAKLKSNLIFNISNKNVHNTDDGSSTDNDVQYSWNTISPTSSDNINILEFIKGQTITASFDEGFTIRKSSSSGSSGTTKLIYSTSSKRRSTDYTGGYIIFDSGTVTKQYKDSGGNLQVASVDKISGIDSIDATNNGDKFIGGYNNIAYLESNYNVSTAAAIGLGVANSGGILSYENWGSVSQNINLIVTFNVSSGNISSSIVKYNNKAPIGTDTTNNGIREYIGSEGNDTFVVADYTNLYKMSIIIDGGGGLNNKVSFKNLGSAIIFDTTKANPLSDYTYAFKNIQGYELTSGNDTLYGSLKNNVTAGGNINIDGSGGTNTVDYTQSGYFVGGSSSQIWSLIVDLKDNFVSKLGYDNSTPTPTKINNTDYLTNFSTYKLQGNYTNVNVVFGDDLTTTLYSFSIGGATSSNANYQVDFSNLSNYGITVDWNNNIMTIKSATSQGVAVSGVKNSTFNNFNSIVLAGATSILNMTISTSSISSLYLYSGSVIDGGASGSSTLNITCSSDFSSATIDLNASSAFSTSLSLTQGTTSISGINIKNFKTFSFKNTGVNSFEGGDNTNFNLTMNDTSSAYVGSKVDYSGVTSKITLTFSIVQINSISILKATANKVDAGNVTDTISNAGNFTLGNVSGNQVILCDLTTLNLSSIQFININAGNKSNIISFENFTTGFTSATSPTISSGEVDYGNYKITNAQSLKLTNQDDTINNSEDSNITIDGAKGSNTIVYTHSSSSSSFSRTFVIVESGQSSISINVSKSNDSSSSTDILKNFSNIDLSNDNQSINFMAKFSKNPDSTSTSAISNVFKFGQSTNNSIDYSNFIGTAASSSDGISFTISKLASSSTLAKYNMEIDVNRDIGNTTTTPTNTIIKDTIYGNVSTIKGSNYNNAGDSYSIDISTLFAGSSAGWGVSYISIIGGSNNRMLSSLSLNDSTTVNYGLQWNLTSGDIMKDSSTSPFMNVKNIAKIKAFSQGNNDFELDNTSLYFNITGVSNANYSYNTLLDLQQTVDNKKVTFTMSLSATNGFNGNASNEDSFKFLDFSKFSSISGTKSDDIFYLDMGGTNQNFGKDTTFTIDGYSGKNTLIFNNSNSSNTYNINVGKMKSGDTDSTQLSFNYYSDPSSSDNSGVILLKSFQKVSFQNGSQYNLILSNQLTGSKGVNLQVIDATYLNNLDFSQVASMYISSISLSIDRNTQGISFNLTSSNTGNSFSIFSNAGGLANNFIANTNYYNVVSISNVIAQSFNLQNFCNIDMSNFYVKSSSSSTTQANIVYSLSYLSSSDSLQLNIDNDGHPIVDTIAMQYSGTTPTTQFLIKLPPSFTAGNKLISFNIDLSFVKLQKTIFPEDPNSKEVQDQIIGNSGSGYESILSNVTGSTSSSESSSTTAITIKLGGDDQVNNLALLTVHYSYTDKIKSLTTDYYNYINYINFFGFNVGGSSNKPTIWEIDYINNYNYAKQDPSKSSSRLDGTYFVIYSNSMKLDLSNLTNKGQIGVSLQAGASNTAYSDPTIYLAQSKYLSYFYTSSSSPGTTASDNTFSTVRTPSISNSVYQNMYTDTTITLSSTSANVGIGAQWLYNYYNYCNTNNVKGNFIIDGTTDPSTGNINKNAIDISFDGNMKTTFGSNYLYIDVTKYTVTSGSVSDYNAEIGLSSGGVKDLGFHIRNVNQIVFNDSINKTFNYNYLTNINIDGGSGSNIINFTSDIIVNASTVSDNTINLTIDPYVKNSSVVGERIQGNIGDSNISVSQFDTINLSKVKVDDNTAINLKFNYIQSGATYYLPQRAIKKPSGNPSITNVYNQVLDLKNITTDVFTLTINSSGSTANDVKIDINDTTTSSSLTVYNAFDISLNGKNNTVNENNNYYSFNISGSGTSNNTTVNYANATFYTQYNSSGHYVVKHSGATSDTSIVGYDFLSNVQVSGTSASSLESSDHYYANPNQTFYVDISDTSINNPFKTTAKEDNNNVIVNASNEALDIKLYNGINDQSNHTKIIADNLTKFSITSVDDVAYKVIRVDSNVYYDHLINNKDNTVVNASHSFNGVSGYYVILDTVNHNFVYIAGDNIDKSVFNFIMSKNDRVETVKNFNELSKYIENSTTNNQAGHVDRTSQDYNGGVQNKDISQDHTNTNGAFKDPVNIDVVHEQHSVVTSSHNGNKALSDTPHDLTKHIEKFVESRISNINDHPNHIVNQHDIENISQGINASNENMSYNTNTMINNFDSAENSLHSINTNHIEENVKKHINSSNT